MRGFFMYRGHYSCARLQFGEYSCSQAFALLFLVFSIWIRSRDVGNVEGVSVVSGGLVSVSFILVKTIGCPYNFLAGCVVSRHKGEVM